MSSPEPPTLPGVGTSIVRTGVPAAWGALLAWLLSLGLPADVAAAADRVDELLVLVCVTGVYAGARWLERQRWMPRWLSRVLLGSTQQPVYLHTLQSDGVYRIANKLTAAEADELRDKLHRSLDEHGGRRRSTP